MSIDGTLRIQPTPLPTSAELGRMLDNGQWDQVKELIGITPDEAERLLSEGDWIDIDEVNKLLGISDEELASTT